MASRETVLLAVPLLCLILFSQYAVANIRIVKIEKGANGWKAWPEGVKYERHVHCDNGTDNHRLRFHCAQGDKFMPDCVGAKLLVCNPSKLDRNAFPDADYPEENEVLTRANAFARINRDKNHEITRKCMELMEECKIIDACKKTMAERDGKFYDANWNGFMVTREEGNKFLLELPFAHEEKITIHAEDFFIKFGSYNSPLETRIAIVKEVDNEGETQIKSANDAQEVLLEEYDGKVQTESEKRFGQFRDNKEGMPLNVAKHLWTLGLDILPIADGQFIKFYTQGFDITSQSKSVCQKEEKKLSYVPKTRVGVIDSQFYYPNEINEKRNTAVVRDSVALNGTTLVEEMGHYLVDADFFVHALLQEGAKLYIIKVVIVMASRETVLLAVPLLCLILFSQYAVANIRIVKIEKGANGWKAWPEGVKYERHVHCDNGTDNHRLRFHCAQGDKFMPDCVGAKLLVCNPSKLDRNAFPDADYPEENEVLTRANAFARINRDKNHEITRKCMELMEECKIIDACKKTMAERDGKFYDANWNGFMVTREEGNKFLLELPFAHEEKITIHAEDFFIKFGSYNSPLETRIAIVKEVDNEGETQIKSANDAQEVLLEEYDGKVQTESEKRFGQFRDNKEGMPLNVAKHLWTLGLDILPIADGQFIKFYTQGFDITSQSKSVCQKEEKKLSYVPKTRVGVIDSQFYYPNEINEKRNTAVVRDSVALNGTTLVEEMGHYLVDADFFVHALLQEGAKHFSISLQLGVKKPDDLLGKKLLEISANFTDGGKLCVINFFPSHGEKNCTCVENGIRQGIQPFENSTKSPQANWFWIWVKIRDGNVLVSVNCLKQEFKWEMPYFSPQNYISYEGDITPEMTGRTMAIENKKFINSNPKGKPTLTVYPIQIGKENGIEFDTEPFFFFNGNLPDKEEMLKLEILMVSVRTDAQNRGVLKIGMQQIGHKEDCPPEGKEKKCKCWEFRNGAAEATMNGYTCSLEFNLILHYNKGSKYFTLYLEGRKMNDEMEVEGGKMNDEMEIQDVAPNYIQMKGDFGLPAPACLALGDRCLPVLKSGDKLRDFGTFEVVGKSIIIYGLILYDANTKFEVGLRCKNCDPENKADLLLIKIDMEKSCASATSSRSNKTLQKIDCVDEHKFPFSYGVPFWIKIMVDKVSKDYQIFVDEANKPLMQLKSGIDEGARVNQIKIKDKPEINVFNQLFLMPYQFPLRKLEDKPMVENSTFIISMQFLKNAKSVEFFLVNSGPGDSISKLGLGTPEEQGKISEEGGDVYLHMKSMNKFKEFCVSTTFNPTVKTCGNATYANVFMPQKTYTWTFTLTSKQGIRLKIDNGFPELAFPIISTERSPLNATHAVFVGDIVLMDKKKSTKAVQS